MGDKPSVEAKNLQADIDDNNLYLCMPLNPQDAQTAADTANTSSTDRASNNIDNAGSAVASAQPDVLVNGVWQSRYVSPSLNARFASSPKRRMKQSKSANYNMNGDTTAMPGRDGKRSLSMEGTIAGTDGQPADNSAAENCVAASHSDSASNNSALVEPSSPSASSAVTVVSLVHADSEGRQQKSGYWSSLLSKLIWFDLIVNKLGSFYLF